MVMFGGCLGRYIKDTEAKMVIVEMPKPRAAQDQGVGVRDATVTVYGGLGPVSKLCVR